MFHTSTWQCGAALELSVAMSGQRAVHRGDKGFGAMQLQGQGAGQNEHTWLGSCVLYIGISAEMQCAACACLQVKAVRVEGSQLVQQGDTLVIIEPSEE